MIFAIVSIGFYQKEIDEIKNNTNIEIVGRFFAYPDAINEFVEKYENIEMIIISEDFYNQYHSEIDKLVEVDNYKRIVLLKEKRQFQEVKGKIQVYEISDFLKEQKNIYLMELEKEDMDMSKLEIEKSNLVNPKVLNDLDIEKKQTSFLESSLGRTINLGLDLGIRALLPNSIEEGIIALKDAILENGFKEGIKNAIDDVIKIGKATGNILSGNYENIEQVQMAVKSGGLIDTVSGVLDYSLNLANKTGAIDNQITSILRYGKNTVLDTISSKIDNELTNQLKYVQKVQTYSDKWRKAYEEQDFNGMEKAYKNMENYLEKSMPFEKTLQEARIIENLHNLIKNKGKSFDLSQNEIELAERLAI